MSNGWILNVMVHDQNTAILKPKSDIAQILHQNGYSRFYFDAEMPKIVRLGFANQLWKFKLNFVEDGDDVFIQYPLYSHYAFLSLTKQLSKRNVHKYLIIHDIESVRYNPDDKRRIDREIRELNQYDGLIAHNQKMVEWLLNHGVVIPCVALNLFDYLTDTPLIANPVNELEINFAGNLKKAPFLSSNYFKTPLHVFGINCPEKFANNVIYEGSFTPEDLLNQFSSGFGLVWDGTSGEKMAGVGEYLKLNSPHKISAYLAAGIPVIVSKESALADYITDHNLGYAVNNLHEVDSIMQNITEEKWTGMRQAVQNVSAKLRNGQFVLTAISKLKGKY